LFLISVTSDLIDDKHLISHAVFVFLNATFHSVWMFIHTFYADCCLMQRQRLCSHCRFGFMLYDNTAVTTILLLVKWNNVLLSENSANLSLLHQRSQLLL